MLAVSLQRDEGRRPRRDKRRAANRERLLQSALELVSEQGEAGLSMVAITKHAGMHHGAFYAHFRNVEECIGAAARRLSSDQRAVSARIRASILDGLSEVPRTRLELDVIELSLRAIAQHAQVYQVLLRTLYAPGPIGDVAREQRDLIIQELSEFLRRTAIAEGVAAAHMPELDALARHLSNLYLGAASDLTEGRTSDVAGEARRIDRYARRLVRTELRRMLQDTGTPR
jgi:AcrR family transcriptional regulator